MKTYNDYIDLAIEKGAEKSIINYMKDFISLKDFLNNAEVYVLYWFFKYINDKPENLLLIEDKNHVLYLASKNGYKEIIKLLLQHSKVKESLSKEDYKNYKLAL